MDDERSTNDEKSDKDTPKESPEAGGFEVIEGGITEEERAAIEKLIKEEEEKLKSDLPENVEPIPIKPRKQTAHELEISKINRVAIECDRRYEVLQLDGYPPDLFIIRDKKTGLVFDQIHAVRNHVMKVLNDPILKNFESASLVPIYGIKERDATDFIKIWLASKTEAATRITNFIGLGNSDKYLHSFDFHPSGRPFDHWMEIFDRIESAEAIIAWIAGCFTSKSYRGQAIWLYGDGGDSKSVMSDTLCRILGSASVQLNSIDSINRFFVGNNWLKRLVVFHEALPEVSRNQRFKSLVCDPFQEHEQKYQISRQIPVHFRFWLNSNHLPEIDNVQSDKRRLLYSRIKPFKGKAKSHEEVVRALCKEFPDFIAYAFDLYDRICGDNQMIEGNELSIERVISQDQIDFQCLMESCFHFVDYDRLPKDLKKKARIDLKSVIRITNQALNKNQAMLRSFNSKSFYKYLKNAKTSINLFAWYEAGRFYGLKGLIKKNGDISANYKPYQLYYQQE